MGSGRWTPDTYYGRAAADEAAGRDTFDYSRAAIESGRLQAAPDARPQGAGPAGEPGQRRAPGQQRRPDQPGRDRQHGQGRAGASTRTCRSCTSCCWATGTWPTRRCASPPWATPRATRCRSRSASSSPTTGWTRPGEHGPRGRRRRAEDRELRADALRRRPPHGHRLLGQAGPQGLPVHHRRRDGLPGRERRRRSARRSATPWPRTCRCGSWWPRRPSGGTSTSSSPAGPPTARTRHGRLLVRPARRRPRDRPAEPRPDQRVHRPHDRRERGHRAARPDRRRPGRRGRVSGACTACSAAAAGTPADGCDAAPQ